MLSINQAVLDKATQEAFDRATAARRDSRRWQSAIARARREFESNPYLEWQDGHLLILSPSNEIYSAGERCQCRAYRSGLPCWHRAAARIVRRCLGSSH